VSAAAAVVAVVKATVAVTAKMIVRALVKSTVVTASPMKKLVSFGTNSWKNT
jgi:hypothetical protein